MTGISGVVPPPLEGTLTFTVTLFKKPLSATTSVVPFSVMSTLFSSLGIATLTDTFSSPV